MANFEDNFIPDLKSGCWLWTAGKFTSGYGTFLFNKKNQRAHRVAWQLYRGEIPTGVHVLHHCDTPACVNPNHLFLGDDKANHADRGRKGRTARGKRNGRAKLTPDDVEIIRNEAGTGKSVGERFGVTEQNVWAIRHNKTWRRPVVQQP